MFLLAILLVVVYGLFLVSVLKGISQGGFEYLLIYLVSFLPFYIVSLSFVYSQTESVFLVRVLQYSKEIVLLFGLGLWWFGQNKNPLAKSWAISRLDWLFIAFIGLCFLYFLLPLGEATFTAKATYLKNILLMCLAYFFGRQIKISFSKWQLIFKIVFFITIGAFVVVVCERFFGIHFHSLIGYSQYYSVLQNIEPSGNYGLNWTFEAQGGQPRYGSFFANPLEFSASMLFGIAIGVIYALSVRYKNNIYKYLFLFVAAFICVLYAYSRATLLAVFLMFIFMAFLLKYKKILAIVFGAAVCLAVYVMFFASSDVRYFIEDTLMFQNSSSITHLVDWLEAVNSMIENPMGIGLAMSGNAGGVADSVRVGGENQFLVYGVQLGIVGMLLYILIIYYAIRNNWRAFRRSNKREEQVVPFIAASVKFGLLLALFTANAEIYLYISLVSWWIVGAGESVYQKYNRTSRGAIHMAKLA